MSLPTYATYYNKDGEPIAKQFTNCGWWLTEDTFERIVMGLPMIKDAVLLEVYGIKIDLTEFSDMNDYPSWEECKKMIIESSPETIKEFGRERALRNAVQVAWMIDQDRKKQENYNPKRK